METIYELAIIGAGPAGIATAVESYVMGLRDIVLLEKATNHNATIRQFYKENKRVDKDWRGQKIELDGHVYFMDGTKESTLDFFDQLLDHESLELRTHTEVHTLEETPEYFEITTNHGTIRARYVVITIGRMGKPNKPEYKIPPSIKHQVHFNLDGCGHDELVMVVGGGDSALEYALELSRYNQVFLSYRRGSFERANPTNQREIAQAIERHEVTPLFFTTIIGLENESGQVKVLLENGSSIVVDRIVYAIGGTTPSAFLRACGIDESEGKPLHNEHYETNIARLFVAGDITQESGGSIALGLNHGYAIAQKIAFYEGKPSQS